MTSGYNPCRMGYDYINSQCIPDPNCPNGYCPPNYSPIVTGQSPYLSGGVPTPQDQVDALLAAELSLAAFETANSTPVQTEASAPAPVQTVASAPAPVQTVASAPAPVQTVATPPTPIESVAPVQTTSAASATASVAAAGIPTWAIVAGAGVVVLLLFSQG